MPIVVPDLSHLTGRTAHKFVYLLLSGMSTDSRKALEVAFPRLDERAAAEQIALVTGEFSDRFDDACLAHHGFDVHDWKVRPPCILVTPHHPDGFDAALEPAGSLRAGYPMNAIVFSLEVGLFGDELVAAVEAVLAGFDEVSAN